MHLFVKLWAYNKKMSTPLVLTNIIYELIVFWNAHLESELIMMGEWAPVYYIRYRSCMKLWRKIYVSPLTFHNDFCWYWCNLAPQGIIVDHYVKISKMKILCYYHPCQCHKGRCMPQRNILENAKPVYIILSVYVMSHCEGNLSHLHGIVALQGTILSFYFRE